MPDAVDPALGLAAPWHEADGRDRSEEISSFPSDWHESEHDLVPAVGLVIGAILGAAIWLTLLCSFWLV